MLTLHKVHEPILNMYLFSTVSNYFQFMIEKLKLTLLGLGGGGGGGGGGPPRLPPPLPSPPYQTFLGIF